jgi:hypothetical protein
MNSKQMKKLGFYQAMTEQGIRKAELARRLGWHVPQVDRPERDGRTLSWAHG